MHWRSGLLTASSAALLAGCGGGGHQAQPPPKPPRIPAGVAARLAAEADRVAAMTPGTCAARDAANRLRSDVIASVGQLPARYQEPLTSAANGLAARLAACTEPPPPKPSEHGHHGHGHRKKKDEGD
jgi:hypothetical protein